MYEFMCDFKLIPFSTSYSYYKINEQLGILNRLIIDSLDEPTALQKGRFTKPPRLQNSSKR